MILSAIRKPAYLLFIAVFIFSACPAENVTTTDKPVKSLEVLKNGAEIPVPSGSVTPSFSIMEEKSVILGVKLNPDVLAGVHWQSSRGIVDLSGFSGPEIVMFARYGGETNITVRAANAVNEVPLFETVNVTVIPTSYYKWNYKRDGWKDMPPSTPFTVDRIYNRMLMLSGETSVHENPALGGLVLDGPGTLVIGSVMPTATNSVYDEDPAMDDTAQLDFSRAPRVTITRAGATEKDENDKDIVTSRVVVEDQSIYTGRIRISAEYEILVEPARRQGLRLQISNNTLERDKASVFTNWLVAEYTPETHRSSGTLSGVFNAASVKFDPNLNPDKKERIPLLPAPSEAEIARLTVLEQFINGEWSGLSAGEQTAKENSLTAAQKTVYDEFKTKSMQEITDAIEVIKDDWELRQYRGALSNSFVCLALPDGKVLIRSIRIETAD